MPLIKGLITFLVLFKLRLLHAHPLSYKSGLDIAVQALKVGNRTTLRESKEDRTSYLQIQATVAAARNLNVMLINMGIKI